MTMQNDINDAIAEALESVEKKEAQDQAQAQADTQAEEVHVIDEATLESEIVADAPEG